MNTYLKIDTALPTGPAYLNLNTLSLPNALINVGNLVRGYRFTNSYDDVTGASSSQLIGTTTAVTDGYVLGKNGYIDTGAKETSEFLWVILVRTPSNGDGYSPTISNFVNAAVSTDGKACGQNLAKSFTGVKMSPTADTTTSPNFTASPLTIGNWALYALTRKLVTGTTYQYHFSMKTPNQTKVLKSSVNAVGVVPDLQSNVCIGWAPKSGTQLVDVSTTVNLASIHNIGLDQAALGTLVDNLITELAAQNIIL
ncbi:hypothetical protein [Acinetobacter baumannii]|uniref:hypothetical protein n=1 Tax=Acinetobacter baumannii TaxID=470 RepID=UPI002228300F|nr:hypothetical protein [Acinetobacter baumannii]MCW3174452.1 hypothetical protein [Acinetobacter baumannii]